MSALSVIGANLITSQMAPLTAKTGGTSASDPSAGTDADTEPGQSTSPITTKDKAGAGILTVLVILAVVGASIWIIM